MSRTAYCDSITREGISSVYRVQSCTVNVSWDYHADDDYVRAGFRAGLSNPPTDDWDGDGITVYVYDTISGLAPARYDWPLTNAAVPSDGSTISNVKNGPRYTLDRTFYFQAYVTYHGTGTNIRTSSVRSCKMDAIEATSGSPYASSVTATTAAIGCDYYPNTYESGCDAALFYKKTTDSTWTQAGAVSTTSGYDYSYLNRNLTGLTSSTQYQYRLLLDRKTNNLREHTGTTGTFTTLTNTPAITTGAATNLATTSVTLNSTFTIGDGTGCEVYFKYGTSNPPTTTSSTQSAAASGAYSLALTGLDASTTYYFQAYASFSTPSGSPSFGSVLSFATTADPAAEAQQEARMQVYEYKRKYGVILTAQPLFFTLQTPSGTNSNTFVVAASVTAADCLISLDGGAFAQTTNQPATLGNGYTLILTAAEMAANEIDVIIKDASGGPDFRDAHLRVITHLQLGSVDIDAATGQKAGTTALKLTGYQAGHGLSATGGATGHDIDGILGDMVQAHGNVTSGAAAAVQLADGFAATNDYYNGAVILFTAGDGVGQARIIIDYVSDGSLTLNKTLATALSSNTDYVILAGSDSWGVSPGAQLAALPTFASSYADMLQFVFQRFAYQRTQSATEFTMFKVNGADKLTKGGVDDNGTLQTHNILTTP